MTEEKPEKKITRKRIVVTILLLFVFCLLLSAWYIYPTYFPMPVEVLKKKANRIVIVVGLNDDFSYDDDYVLFEVADKNVAAEVLGNIEIGSYGETGWLSRFTTPFFVCYRGRRRIGCFAIAGGVGIYEKISAKLYYNGFEIEPAILTPESMEWLSRWLARRGLRDSLFYMRLHANSEYATEDLAGLAPLENEIRITSVRRKMALYKAILPPETFQPIKNLEEHFLRGADWDDYPTAGLEDAIRPEDWANKQENIIRCLKLYGIEDAPWSSDEGFDLYLESFPFNGFSFGFPFDFILTAADIDTDAALARGVARLACYKSSTTYGAPFEDEIVKHVLNIGLNSRYRTNRLATLKMLHDLARRDPEIWTPHIRQYFFSGSEFEYIESSQEDRVRLLQYARKWGLPASIDASDRAATAFVLAHLGDKESLPEIKKLLETANEIDREVLQDAVYMLED